MIKSHIWNVFYVHENCNFLIFYVFQGNAATYLRCGGKPNIGFVGNLLLFATVKEFWKSIKNWQSYSRGEGGTLFWLTVYRVTPAGCDTVHQQRTSTDQSSRFLRARCLWCPVMKWLHVQLLHAQSGAIPACNNCTWNHSLTNNSVKALNGTQSTDIN